MSINDLIFPYDYILLAILLLIVIICTIKGIINSFLGLLTWIGAILVTIYAYENLSDFIIKQILNIKFFQNYEYLTSILSIALSIPIIFIISLFILKRIRNFMSSNIDKQITGLIFDKLFGFLYGLFFSYLITSALLIFLERFNLNAAESWLDKNSTIINKVDNFNNTYIYIINKEDEI